MSTSIGRAVDLIELMCSNVNPALSENHELVRKLINMKLKEFAAKTGILESRSTITTVANQQEYELPEDSLNITLVDFDGKECQKIIFNQVNELKKID